MNFKMNSTSGSQPHGCFENISIVQTNINIFGDNAGEHIRFMVGLYKFPD
jgi:hypothetical protein